MMKARLSIYRLVAVLVICGLGVCGSIYGENGNNQEVPDIHSSKISASWSGLYSGIITAANGQKIKVLINLEQDETFELGYSYVNQPNSFFSVRGKFECDKTEGKINLNLKDFPSYYWIVSNGLVQSDNEWKIITGNYAENYVLKKIVP